MNVRTKSIREINGQSVRALACLVAVLELISASDEDGVIDLQSPNVCVPSSVVLWYIVLYVTFGCSLGPFQSWAMQVLHRASPNNELVASIEGGRGKVGCCE